METARDNNVMHAKPDLRVFFEVEIAGSGSVITDVITLMQNLDNLRIRDKKDFENAEAIFALGYPAVAPLIPHLFSWIQDMNWPVAKRVAPFLTSIGRPIFPELDRVLASNDLGWHYWCIQDVIAELPKDLASEYRNLLERLAYTPTENEKYHELDEIATDALKDFGWYNIANMDRDA